MLRAALDVDADGSPNKPDQHAAELLFGLVHFDHGRLQVDHGAMDVLRGEGWSAAVIDHEPLKPSDPLFLLKEHHGFPPDHFQSRLPGKTICGGAAAEEA